MMFASLWSFLICICVCMVEISAASKASVDVQNVHGSEWPTGSWQRHRIAVRKGPQRFKTRVVFKTIAMFPGTLSDTEMSTLKSELKQRVELFLTERTGAKRVKFTMRSTVRPRERRKKKKRHRKRNLLETEIYDPFVERNTTTAASSTPPFMPSSGWPTDQRTHRGVTGLTDSSTDAADLPPTTQSSSHQPQTPRQIPLDLTNPSEKPSTAGRDPVPNTPTTKEPNLTDTTTQPQNRSIPPEVEASSSSTTYGIQNLDSTQRTGFRNKTEDFNSPITPIPLKPSYYKDSPRRTFRPTSVSQTNTRKETTPPSIRTSELLQKIPEPTTRQLLPTTVNSKGTSSKPTFVSQVTQEFRLCLHPEGPDGRVVVPIDAYTTAYISLCKIFDMFGPIFSFAGTEIKGKMGVLRGLQEKDRAKGQENYETMESMFAYEYSLTEDWKRTGVNANRLITKALRYIAALIRAIQDPDRKEVSMTTVGRELYNEILAPDHPWIVRAVVYVALMSFPTKQDMLDKFQMPDNENTRQLLTDMSIAIDDLYYHLSDLYKQYE